MIEQSSPHQEAPKKQEPAVIKSFKAAMERAGDDPKKLEVIAEYLQNYEQTVGDQATQDQKDRLAFMRSSLKEAQKIPSVVGKMIEKAKMPAGPTEPSEWVTNEISTQDAQQISDEAAFAKEATERTAKAIKEQEFHNMILKPETDQEGSKPLDSKQFTSASEQRTIDISNEAKQMAQRLKEESELPVVEGEEITLEEIEKVENIFAKLKAKLKKAA